MCSVNRMNEDMHVVSALSEADLVTGGVVVVSMNDNSKADCEARGE